MSIPGIQAYAQITPCIAPGNHRFTAVYPKAGEIGAVTVLCERCGLIRN